MPEILIADDSPSNRLTLAALASDIEADVLIATSGLEAIKLATEKKPALVLLDADMPDMDGYQVINQLAGNGQTTNIPIILMETNFSPRKASLHGGSVWPTEILYKPINPDQLRQKVAALLDLEKIRQDIVTIREFEDEMGEKGEEGVVGIDADGRIGYCNPHMIKLLRSRYSEVIGTGLETIFEKDFHETTSTWDKHTVAQALANKKTVQVKKAVLWTNDGGKVTTTFVAVPIQGHERLTGLLVFKDISRRSRTDEQITSLTTHDLLTGLSNRFKFEEVLSGLIELYKAKTNVLISRKRSAPCAVIYVGLDHFSHINKGLGHNAGDKLLQGVAHRLKSCISDLDIAARLGGDEFTIALTHMFDAADASKMAQKILRSFDEPFLIEGNEIYSSACIGIATYPECGDTSAELLTNSSVAMQSAKTKGNGEVKFFTDSLNENYLDKIGIENGLRDALSAGELEVSYTPYFASGPGEVKGYYASLVWPHATKGIIDTSKLLDGMEQAQLQTRFSYKILKEGCLQFVDWQKACPSREDLSLVIPFPGFHLINTNFIGSLRNALSSSGISPQHLILEIAETKADFTLREFLPLAEEISALGVKLSLNLFASPRTPLTHLFQLNLDTIRIDITVIESITDNPKSAIFFKSIVSMAHDLGIEVIADGMTTQKEATLATSLGVDGLKGDLLLTGENIKHQLPPTSVQSSTNR
ncbi:MAG: diguanylate cyclase (GGDEF)-like protein [Candidatus Azotimanducaceae bacterium]